MFHVTAMGHPPAESSETSRAFLGTINMFGGPLEITAKSSKGKKMLTETVLSFAGK